MKLKLIVPLSMNSGTLVLPAGTELEVTYNRELAPDRVRCEQSNGRFFTIRCVNAHKYFKQFTKEPSLKRIETMMDDARCTTVTGKRNIEADGCGPDGFPAWPLAMGLI